MFFLTLSPKHEYGKVRPKFFTEDKNFLEKMHSQSKKEGSILATVAQVRLGPRVSCERPATGWL